jgi:hypothetical protein
MYGDISELALKDRVCDATQRIPDARWPLYSTTLEATVAQGGTTAVLTFEAERDTLFTDMSISAIDDGDTIEGRVSVEYCDTVIADNTDIGEYAYCCQRKPIFLQEVKENKRMKFFITLDTAATSATTKVTVSLSGFQGDGCCS